MAIGMGIGAFAEGLASGIALGDTIQKGMDERELRSGVRAAETDARAKYGDELGDEGYSYMMKRTAAAYAKAGRMDEARKYLQWSEDADTKANTKRFAAGLRQIDMGDIDGFDKTLQGLGKAKGYGPEIGIQFERGEDGKVITNKGPDGQTYYRLRITPPGAKEPVLQDLPAGKLKDTYARWFNPQSAFEAERAQAADRAKREADLKDYEGKKKIDAQYADPERARKERGEAIDTLRKRDTGAKPFDELSETEKESAIEAEIRLRRGTSAQSPAPAAPGIVMDRATGKPVQPPAQTAPGLSQAAPAAAAPQSRAPSVAATPNPAAVVRPAPAPGEELAALEAEAQKLDAQMKQTQARSRNPEAAEMLLGPMRTARAELDNRIRLAREARGTAASAPSGTAPDMSAELAEVDRRLGEIKQRGPGYEGTVSELEMRRNALIEQMNQARRTVGVSTASPAAPGLRMGAR